MSLRIALAQINTTVGDLAGNCDRILASIATAKDMNVDVVAFPEMAITGYPPEDLLLKSDFVGAAIDTLHSLAPATRGLTAIVGCLHTDRDLYNAAAIFHDGQLVSIYHKQHLPNYGVFDENRYFQSGTQRIVFNRGGVIIGVSICEDIWYPDGPPQAQAAQAGAQVLINISASPYYMGKGHDRERMIATRAADSTAFVAYCNLVGGQDELMFDGHSVVCDPEGGVVARGRQFEEDMVVADLDVQAVFRTRLRNPLLRRTDGNGSAFETVELSGLPLPGPRPPAPPALSTPLDRVAEVYRALVLGTRDYVRKNGFRQVVLGLSGGVDSSLTATIAVDALGPENVTGVAMPTRYSSPHSLEDAEEMARNLGMHFLTVPIDQIFQSYLDMLAPAFEGLSPDVTEENIQPRIRGTLLMALSNKFGWLLLSTGNKSEVGVGYSTLYGDTAGGFALLKDVPKTLVYELSQHRNALAGYDLIPQRVLEKPPSAELRPDQKDTDTLPPYAVLDPIINAYVEEGYSPNDIAALGFDEAMVGRVIRMIDRSEYKRRQSPPGIKITSRAFGKDWRLPITNRFTAGRFPKGQA
ncbi:MAG: NAD+ synthase [Bacteroidetes bacterium]|nr:NAD+ synthase [Bacteroidota bacterium]MCL5027371.1 NAD+ synthase [Chloroflexota bacterium]